MSIESPGPGNSASFLEMAGENVTLYKVIVGDLQRLADRKVTLNHI